MRIPGIFVEVRGDYSFLREDLDKAKTIAKAGAADIANSLNGAMDARGVSTNTNALINNISKVQSASKNASVDFAALTKSTEGVGGAVGMTDKAFASFQARMLQTKAQQEADRAFNALTKSMGMSRLESAQFHMQMGDTTGGLKILGGVAMSTAPYILAVGAAAIYAGKACFDSALAADRLNKAYGAIEGSSTGARQQLKFLYDESNRLGMQFQDSAAAAKGFFAAGKGTTLEGDLHRIYSGVSEAGSALSLSKDEMSGVFLALGQMMSKGKVQAEELRGQLGERLPGAFTLAAKSMGVTTAELDKMLEQGQVLAEDLLPKLADALHEKYGKAAMEATDGAAQSVNRMSTEWELFKSNVMDNSATISAIKAITGALRQASDELTQSEMRKAGIKKSGGSDYGVYDVMAGTGYDDSYDYTAQEIEDYRTFQTIDQDAIKRKKRWAQYQKEQAADAANMEKAYGRASAAYKELTKDTDRAKRDEIMRKSADGIRDMETQRANDPENAALWDSRIIEAKQETARRIADLGKKGVASAKKDAREKEQALDAYYSYVGTRSEESEESMVDAENRKHDKIMAAAQKYYAKSAEWPAMQDELERGYQEHITKIHEDATKKKEDAWDKFYAYVGSKGAGFTELEIARAERSRDEQIKNLDALGITEEQLYERRAQVTAAFEAKRTEITQKAANVRRDITEAMQDKIDQATGTDAQKRATQTDKEIREWREKWLEAGKGTAEEFDKMAVNYRSIMEKANDETTLAYKKLWENAIDRIDGAFANMWKDFITGSKSAMESLKSMFQNTLAEIAHAAITKPIVVQMSGMFTGSSLFSSAAYAGGGGGIFSGGGTSGSTTGAGGVATGGASGSGMNVGSLVSPSWFTPSSWAASANSWAAQSMPGLFGTGASAYGAGMTAGTTAYGSAFGSAYSSALATGATTGAAVAEATAAAEAASTAATAAANGAQATLTGTLGAMGIAGGIGMLLGNMLGDKTGGMSTGGGAAIGAGIGSIVPGIGTVIGGLVGGAAGFLGGSIFGGGKGPRTASLYSAIDSTWGGDWEKNASDVAWGSRGMDTQSEFAKGMYKWIGDTANTQREEIKSIIAATDNADAVNKALEDTRVLFGHGFRGRDGHSIYEWNVNSDMEANMKAIAEEMKEVLWEGVMNASKDLDWSSEDFKTDFSTVEGTQTTYATIAALDAINDAIGQVKEPTDGLTTALKAVDTQFDAYKDTLEALGYGVKTLTQLEADRAEVLAKVKAEYTKAFDDDMEARYLAIYGTSTEQQAQALRVKHENELTAAGTSYGKDSLQYFQLLATQEMERNAFAATTAQTALATAQNNYVSALQSSYTAMKGFASSVKKLREDLLLDSELSTLSVPDRYGTASARLADLTAKALAGDTDAMAELQDVSRTYLEVSKEYNADFAAYRNDFDRVQGILQQVEGYASTQADEASKQYEAITGGALAIVTKLDELKAAFLSAQTAANALKPSASSDATTRALDQMYQSTLGRSADAAGLTYWKDQLSSGAMSAGDISRAIAGSAENVNQLYESILGRTGEQAGIEHWSGLLASGAMTEAEVIKAFYNSPEYLASHSHAKGGIASGWSIVGEEGPEAVNFTNPARVYTASQTRAALGGDGADLAGELRALRQEVAGMRAENERLLTSVNTNTQKTRDYLEKFDEDGMPVTREA